jgi:hypothetical protein
MAQIWKKSKNIILINNLVGRYLSKSERTDLKKLVAAKSILKRQD